MEIVAVPELTARAVVLNPLVAGGVALMLKATFPAYRLTAVPAESLAVIVNVKGFPAVKAVALEVTVKEAGYQVKASVPFVRALPDSSVAVKVPVPALDPPTETEAVVLPLENPEELEETKATALAPVGIQVSE